MEMADYWLTEKQCIHKLFKVLVPRYENYTIAFTRMFNAPHPYPSDGYKKAILELRGNPYPSLLPDMQTNRNLIHNILLDEAKKAYRTQKYKDIANKISEVEATATQESNEKKLEVKQQDILDQPINDDSDKSSTVPSETIEKEK